MTRKRIYTNQKTAPEKPGIQVKFGGPYRPTFFAIHRIAAEIGYSNGTNLLRQLAYDFAKRFENAEGIEKRRLVEQLKLKLENHPKG